MNWVAALNQWVNKDKAIEEFKVVYSADISFRDVADKINAFYSQNAMNLIGGEGGIRTPGTLRHTRFRVGHIRPLCHLSNYNRL